MAEFQSLVGSIGGDGNMRGLMNVPQSGTKDYNELYNKPKIEGVTLEGNKTFEELTLIGLTNIEIYNLINGTNILGE